MQPGQVIPPGGQDAPKEPEQAPDTLTQVPPQTAPTETVQTTIEDSGLYNTPETFLPAGGEMITWSASEYIAHSKTAGWYAGFGVASAVAALLVLLITGDWFTFGAIIIVAILLGVFASRKPEVLQYTLDETGITIGSRHYVYDEFKSFSIHDEGGIRSIFLMPLKRFMPGLSLYYPPDMEDQIMDAMSLYLPFENRQPDAVDRLMKRVRF